MGFPLFTKYTQHEQCALQRAVLRSRSTSRPCRLPQVETLGLSRLKGYEKSSTGRSFAVNYARNGHLRSKAADPSSPGPRHRCRDPHTSSPGTRVYPPSRPRTGLVVVQRRALCSAAPAQTANSGPVSFQKFSTSIVTPNLTAHIQSIKYRKKN